MSELSPQAIERAWPAPYPPTPPGAVSVRVQQRTPIGAVTSSVQTECERGLVDEKIAVIRKAIATGTPLPLVDMAPDPHRPGGLTLIDQNHTYQAYKELGFKELPGTVRTPAGVEKAIREFAFRPDRLFPIEEMRVVPKFSGKVSEHWAEREARLAREAAEREAARARQAPTCSVCQPQRRADADESFARAKRTGGSEHGGVVYGVGGSEKEHRVDRFTRDGRFLGSMPKGAELPTEVQYGVSEQMMRRDFPNAPAKHFVDGPDGRRYAMGRDPKGNVGFFVEEGGTLRVLSAAERAALPRGLQNQVVKRALGPVAFLPEGANGVFRRVVLPEIHGNVMGAIAGHPPAGK